MRILDEAFSAPPTMHQSMFLHAGSHNLPQLATPTSRRIQIPIGDIEGDRILIVLMS